MKKAAGIACFLETIKRGIRKRKIKRVGNEQKANEKGSVMGEK